MAMEIGARLGHYPTIALRGTVTDPVVLEQAQPGSIDAEAGINSPGTVGSGYAPGTYRTAPSTAFVFPCWCEAPKDEWDAAMAGRYGARAEREPTSDLARPRGVREGFPGRIGPQKTLLKEPFAKILR